MSEDFPQQPKPIEDINNVQNPTPDQEVATAPVTFAGTTEGESNTELPVENVGDGRIEDKDKALDMAYAGKETREEAAALREEGKTLREQVALGDETINSEDNQFKPTSERRHIFETQKNREDLLRRSARKERLADRADREAQEIESWAEILYDNPISDAYRQAHQNIHFTPKDLRYKEEELRRISEGIEWGEYKLAELQNTVGVTGIDQGKDATQGPDPRTGQLRERPPITTESLLKSASGLGKAEYIDLKQKYSEDTEILDRMIEPDIREIYDRYLSLLDAPDTTTITQLSGVFKDVYRKVRIEPMVNEYESNKQILDDIRSGRASSIKQSIETQ